jgi:hypothetical protein
MQQPVVQHVHMRLRAAAVTVMQLGIIAMLPACTLLPAPHNDPHIRMTCCCCVCAAITGNSPAAAAAPKPPPAAKIVNGTVATAAAAATAEAAAGGGAGWVSAVLPPLPPACAGLSAAVCELCKQTASPGDCFTCVRNSALSRSLLTVAVLSEGLAPGSAGNVRLDQCISCANMTAAGDRDT